ncbi:MAG: acylphosphatase, partial [Desulfobacteraceae bacterium]
MSPRSIARKIDVNGIVQGVGFRPFVYQLAQGYQLCGQVSNTPAGVALHVEGA